MTQFTTIRHSHSNWILIRHTEWVDQYRREQLATFDTAMDAIGSAAYIAVPLPAVYKTVYSSRYRGYWIHVTRKVVSETLNGVLNVRSCYIGFVSVDDCPVYLDYLVSSRNGDVVTEWKSERDTISNLKWFVKTQLPPMPSCSVS